jgi:dGTPase
MRHDPTPTPRAALRIARTGAVSLQRAHEDATAVVGRVEPLDRERREALEDALLAPGATRARGAGSRAAPEEPDRLRTCFERDRDRILHAPPFRALAGKTQVFVAPDDHQRTRLTHALEVAQVAVAVARACRLNVALCEAIALGHDCGHGPGGHAAEEALSPYVEGGHDHAVFGADVVLAPLNLCAETLDGVRNHSWSRPAPSTPEGEVVALADRIAYVCHDFEDALRAGVVEASALPDLVRRRCGPTRSGQLDAFVTGLVETIASTGEVALPADLAEALAAFRALNEERIYNRPEARAERRAIVAALGALVERYAAKPELLPPPPSLRAPGSPEPDPLEPRADRAREVVPPFSEAAYRAAVHHVATMTDRAALRAVLAELGLDPTSLPGRVAAAVR